MNSDCKPRTRSVRPSLQLSSLYCGCWSRLCHLVYRVYMLFCLYRCLTSCTTQLMGFLYFLVVKQNVGFSKYFWSFGTIVTSGVYSGFASSAVHETISSGCGSLHAKCMNGDRINRCMKYECNYRHIQNSNYQRYTVTTIHRQESKRESINIHHNQASKWERAHRETVSVI